MTQEQRAVAIRRNTDRTSRRFGLLMFIMAVFSLAMNAFSGAMSGLPKLLRVFWAIGPPGMFLHTSFNLLGQRFNQTVPTATKVRAKGALHELSFPNFIQRFSCNLLGRDGVWRPRYHAGVHRVGTQNQMPPQRIFQSVALGLLGPKSFQGGAKTAALGLFLHFLIAFTWAVIYYMAAVRSHSSGQGR